jgi:predicted nucleic acid-binding protein
VAPLDLRAFPIALTARSVGALLITCNGHDFEELRREEPFDLLVWRTANMRAYVPELTR